MNKIHKKSSILLVLLLGACSIMNSPRGPNEFAVMKSHELVIPGDFELVSPRADMDETGQIRNTEARDIIYGQDNNAGSKIGSSPLLSSGENLLLEKFATDKKDPQIKELLRKEKKEKEHQKSGLWNKMWNSKNTLSKDSTVSDENSASSIKNSKSLNELMKTDSKSKKICNVENGAIQYCDDNKIMKTISIGTGSSNK